MRQPMLPNADARFAVRECPDDLIAILGMDAGAIKRTALHVSRKLDAKPWNCAERIDRKAGAARPVGMHGVAVMVPPKVQRHDDARNPFLADLHRSPDAGILQQARFDQRAAARHDSRGQRAVILMRAGDDDVSARAKLVARVVLPRGVDDDRNAGLAADGAEVRKRDHSALRGVVRHDEHGRRRIRSERTEQLVLLASFGPADHVQRGAREADHLTDPRSEIGVVTALHHHAMLHARRIGKLCNPLAVEPCHRRRDSDRDPRRGPGRDASGFASERGRDSLARDRLELRDLDWQRKDSHGGGCGGLARRSAAEQAHWTGGIDVLAQVQRIADIFHRVILSRHGRTGDMATKLRLEDYPEIRENWAEAVFEGRARCAVTIKSGHTLISDEAPGFAGGAGGTNAGPTPSGLLVAAFAADIPVMLARVHGEYPRTNRSARAVRPGRRRAAPDRDRSHICQSQRNYEFATHRSEINRKSLFIPEAFRLTRKIPGP